MKTSSLVLMATFLVHGANAQSLSTYSADYTANPFLNGSAINLDDSSWVSSAYGRAGAVATNPTVDLEAFFAISSSFYNHSVNSIGDAIALKTSFYSDSTSGSGTKESSVYLMLAPGVSALIGDIGDSSGNQHISLGVGTGAAIVTAPGFTMTTDKWVDVRFKATYAGNNPGGLATFNYELILAGGMVGTYSASGIAQPSGSFYNVVGKSYSPNFGQEGDADSQTVYWSKSPTAVPEPSAALLLGLGGVCIFIMRRR